MLLANNQGLIAKLIIDVRVNDVNGREQFKAMQSTNTQQQHRAV